MFKKVLVSLDGSPLAETALAHQVYTDDPAKTICDVAENQKMDLKIISTHGRTGIGRWAYGSTAGKVLGQIKRPLLLVRSIADET